ncbi:MAG: Hpt domain-containing protein, partial [Candidatus Cloacimonetes bacterium]|nr:Hpt domain-containing protein [Candidatus Cloacimonadota bacterium]
KPIIEDDAQHWRHFNKKALLDTISNDMETYQQLLQIISTNLPEKLEKLETTISARDIRESLSILHAIRGSAQNMHFPQLAELASYLEKNFVQLDPDDAEDILQNMIKEWSIILEIIS